MHNDTQHNNKYATFRIMTLSITLDSESCYAEIVVYAEFHLFIYSAECLGTIYVTKLRCVLTNTLAYYTWAMHDLIRRFIIQAPNKLFD